jgi:hypothetical protein
MPHKNSSTTTNVRKDERERNNAYFPSPKGSPFVMGTLMPAEECSFITTRSAKNAGGHTTPFYPGSTMTWSTNEIAQGDDWHV